LSNLHAGVAAGRSPEFIEMMQVALGYGSGAPRLVRLL